MNARCAACRQITAARGSDEKSVSGRANSSIMNGVTSGVMSGLALLKVRFPPIDSPGEL
jgi:hypothetical protein